MQNTMGSKMLFSLARRCGTVDRQPDSGKRERERTAWRTHIERGQVEDDVEAGLGGMANVLALRLLCRG